MAELTAGADPLTGPRLASEQLRAIAWLRWRILANGFRRKGGAGELIARILLFPFFLALALLPTFGAGVAAWYFAGSGHLAGLSWVLWGAVALTQLLNINLGQPGTTFDPVELIRFPLPLRRFVLVRLCFGLLSPANVIVTLVSVAMVVGVTVARPPLFLAAFCALAIFALTNVLFTRMIFAWVDRWLSTRRAREIFTGLIFLFSLGVQYFNVRVNPAFQDRRHRHAPGQNLVLLEARARRIHPYVVWLPPELTAEALVSADHGAVVASVVEIAACSLFSAAFLGVFALRMRTEFRGENLSDLAASAPPVRASKPPPQSHPALAVPGTPVPALPVPANARRGLFPATLAPLLGKELLVLRRNIGLFYGLIAPAVMVFLFAGRLSARNGSHWVLLAAVAYSLLGLSAMSYNSFGTEGTGAQLYFYAPVPLREIFLAKNVFSMLLVLVQVVLIIGVTSYVAGPPQILDCVFVVLWAVAALLLSTTVGNLRSISAPRKINAGRTMNKAASGVSAYIAIGILAGCAALGFGCELAAAYLQRPWVALALITAATAGAVLVYAQGLNGIEAYALDRRDRLFEELGKKM